MTVTPIRWLVLLNILFVAALAWLWVDKSGHLRNSTWQPPKAVAPAAAPASVEVTAAQASFNAVLERPLFAPDRRPPPTTAAAIADPMADIRITGIFSGENAGVIVFTEGRTRLVRLNESLGPWKLKSIEGRSVTFAQADDTRQLVLAYSSLGVVVPSAAAVTAAPPNQAAAAPLPSRTVSHLPNNEDLARENLRRRNELRAARGLPLLPPGF